MEFIIKNFSTKTYKYLDDFTGKFYQIINLEVVFNISPFEHTLYSLFRTSTLVKHKNIKKLLFHDHAILWF